MREASGRIVVLLGFIVWLTLVAFHAVPKLLVAREFFRTLE
jgi:hypothetical protein